ncbi:MAG: heavy-metal-associated domain-containing protein [Planctomycetota bacterium]
MKNNRWAIAALSLTTLAGCGESTVSPTAAVDDAVEAVGAVVSTIEATPIKLTALSYSETGDPIVDFYTPGMHCEACAATITKRLGEQDAVVDVSADAETKVVRVTFVKDGFNAEESMAAGEAVAAIADAGFGEATPIDPVAESVDEPAAPAAESAG